MKNKLTYLPVLFLAMTFLTTSMHAGFTFLDQRHDAEKMLTMMHLYILVCIIGTAVVIKYVNKR